MKALLLTALLSAPAAAGDLLSVPGLAQLAAEKAKEAQAIGTLTFSLKKGAGAYLPVWTFKDARGIRYVRTGVGWEGTDLGGHPLVPVTLNLPALSGRLWSSAWAQTHVERVKLPDIWFGPVIRAPLVQDRFQWKDWKDYAGLAAAVGF